MYFNNGVIFLQKKCWSEIKLKIKPAKNPVNKHSCGQLKQSDQKPATSFFLEIQS